MARKNKILKIIKDAHPKDLSIEEIAKTSRMSRETVSKYLAVLEAEGKIELSREVGRAKMYKAKNKFSGV